MLLWTYRLKCIWDISMPCSCYYQFSYFPVIKEGSLFKSGWESFWQALTRVWKVSSLLRIIDLPGSNYIVPAPDLDSSIYPVKPVYFGGRRILGSSVVLGCFWFPGLFTRNSSFLERQNHHAANSNLGLRLCQNPQLPVAPQMLVFFTAQASHTCALKAKASATIPKGLLEELLDFFFSPFQFLTVVLC